MRGTGIEHYGEIHIGLAEDEAFAALLQCSKSEHPKTVSVDTTFGYGFASRRGGVLMPIGELGFANDDTRKEKVGIVDDFATSSMDGSLSFDFERERMSGYDNGRHIIGLALESQF